MSGGFQLEAEPFLNVRLAFTHPAKGSVSHYVQDFSPFSTIRELKEDMAAKVGHDWINVSLNCVCVFVVCVCMHAKHNTQRTQCLKCSQTNKSIS